jgi:FkbH-like protein
MNRNSGLSSVTSIVAKCLRLPQQAFRVTLGISKAKWHLRQCNSVGSDTRIYGGHPVVHNLGRIDIGRKMTLRSSFAPTEFSTGQNGQIKIGHNVTINFGATIHADQQIAIGDRVQIGQYSIVSDVAVPGAPKSTTESPAPIRIEDDVWIAGRVTILPGAFIGKGSVITAGSIVSGEIPAGVVAGGIPARVIRHINGQTAPAPSAPDSSPAQSITQKAEPVAETKPDLHSIVLSDFTADDLAMLLSTDKESPRIAAESGPFDQVIQSLLTGPASDIALVWTRPQGVSSGFAGLLAGEPVSSDNVMTEVELYCSAIKQAASRFKYVFVATWSSPGLDQGGIFDPNSMGITRTLWSMNQKLSEYLEPLQNVYVLNAERWLGASAQAFTPRGWYLGKVPFHQHVFSAAVHDIKAALRALSGGAKKLLILDLDDTCWGGIVGDMGWENLRLGGHDSEGEAFVDFQKAVKALTKRGIVLGIVSKNEEETALEAIRKHPEMVLREKDFVGWRINWRDKAQNIAELTKELNLGLQSVVFIDDNPIERGRVKEALPEVLVLDWPEDKLMYATALRTQTCFDVPFITQEDLARTELYASERERQSLMKEVGSVDDWLMSLSLKVEVDIVRPENLARTAQLLNKTNQLNLTTRRLDEGELTEWIKAPSRSFYVISVADRFGEAGLTGIISMEESAGALRIIDLVMSCRVMGRKVEETLLHLAVQDAQRRGAKSVVATYLQTKKNKPTLSLLERSGFTRSGDDFIWDTNSDYPLPDPITLVLRHETQS